MKIILSQIVMNTLAIMKSKEATAHFWLQNWDLWKSGSRAIFFRPSTLSTGCSIKIQSHYFHLTSSHKGNTSNFKTTIIYHNVGLSFKVCQSFLGQLVYKWWVIKVGATKRKVWTRCILPVSQAVIWFFLLLFDLQLSKLTHVGVAVKNKAAASPKIIRKFKL